MKSGSVNEHRGSILLKPEENEQVFRLIGNRCQCLAAGIIQLYLTEPPKHNEWIKKNTGIITLIRDTSKRSFFLRLYCIQRKAMLWEHEVYNSMEYKAPFNYFHTFEAEDCMAAFNFANETDAIVLRNILIEKLNAKARRRNERHSKMEMENQRGMMLPRKNQSISTPSLGLTHNPPDNFSNGTPVAINVNRSMSNISMSKSKKKKRSHEKEAKKKLTTNDIGLPFDFRHVEHMGTDINSCRVIDPELKAFFDKVGISESHLEHQETRDFIYDFIESYGGMNAVKKEIKPASATPTNVQQQVPKPQPKLEPPPPVPARTIPVSTNAVSNNSHQRKAPPLPPVQTQSQVPPPPPAVPPVHRSLPSRPPPPSAAPAPASALPPPPPPPPMPQELPSKVVTNAPPPPPLPSMGSSPRDTDNGNSANDNKHQAPDPRSMLLESIQKGVNLKKINKEETKSPTPRDPRSNLLEEIRSGITLKPVANEPRPNSATPNVAEGGLAAALTRALAERSRAMYSESEDSSEFSDNDDEWDD
ncbi:neural Wiskott-Aldrich syndrome protein [Nasonia vitripennis]|uniref:Wiskott-Aldrich syndrome protein n=1 Tax=Nasonia vitripennis TaxID=7425 RepID=A0A7M7TB20_NASVI|nr:neural Wiskott-Aldrich syndrome protein [Nasonia vitripennis]XP_016845934.1 neural Wiskott-Aldrich syndrome protein [Nasonia vitripennis]XP_031788360.1 neural Wiskott-Aldrich syndrome protein [Nasonia vitripennis]